ncbi:MAG TPA: tRNA lysidine(34) synthetase TilS [bacterium]|nr:tRNA lysidine(34) synthetase TilS [bacterium]
MNSFLDTVRSTIARHHMFGPGDTVVVAVSGGADSMALLHALAAMREELRITLHVAHFDHQLRPGSADDVGFVGTAARVLRIPFTVGTADVSAQAAEQHRSIEDAARRARYGFLTQVAADTGAGVVATAHTRNDQLETVLMRLFDAAPWESLAGIPPVRALGSGARVVRPLLDLSRCDVVTFLDTRGVIWREDPSNRDLTLRRNWMRHAVIPGLEESMPPLGDLLSRVSDVVREADRLLAVSAGQVFDRVHARSGRVLRLPLRVMRVLPGPVLRRLVRQVLVAGTDGGASRVVEDKALNLLSRRRPGQFWAGAWVIRRSYEVFEIAPAPAPDPDHEYELTIPGEVAAADFGVRVRADIVDPEAIDAQAPGEVILDADAAGPVLRMRSARPGDWIRPLGMKGKKKVQDLLVDEKVPRWERGRIPLIVDARGRILWVVGLRISEEARLTERTKRAVRLRVLPLEARVSAAGRA